MPKTPLAISIAWRLFPNKRRSSQGIGPEGNGPALADCEETLHESTQTSDTALIRVICKLLWFNAYSDMFTFRGSVCLRLVCQFDHSVRRHSPVRQRRIDSSAWRLRRRCFDWDSFAAQLPFTLVMMRQDAETMMEEAFASLDRQAGRTQRSRRAAAHRD